MISEFKIFFQDGYENAFDDIAEIGESVKTGIWVGDCFIFTNALNRLNYFVGGEIVTVAHLERPLYLLGYLPEGKFHLVISLSKSVT